MAHPNLLILLGTIRQESATGELLLEQVDGERKFLFDRGELVALRSDAAGEQFGGRLLRQGILDRTLLNQLLEGDKRHRIGEKVVQRGLLSLAERDAQLQSLQEQIMLRALEHSILRWRWSGGSGACFQELEFKLQDRNLIWRTLQECKGLQDLVEILAIEERWRWRGRPDLLDSLQDLPLTPNLAFAVSFFTADPIDFETFRFLSHLDPVEAGRLIAVLWAFGSLELTGADLTSLSAAPAPPSPAPVTPGLILPPPVSPYGPPKRPSRKPGTGPPVLRDLTESLELEVVEEEEPDHSPSTLPVEDLPPIRPRPSLQPPSAQDSMLTAGMSPGPALSIPIPFSAGSVGLPLDLDRKGKPALPTPEAAADQAKALRLLAQARRQLKLGRTVEAVRTLEEVVDLHPDDDTCYETWLLLGSLRMRNPAWAARAIQAFQSAALIRPKEAEPLQAMAEIFRRTGAADDAEACLRQVKEMESTRQGIPSGKRM